MGKRNRDYVERHSDMVEFLSLVRETHYQTLLDRYNICRSTLHNDLKILARDHNVPFVSTRGPDGRVKVMDGWYPNKKYLKEIQVEVIKKMMTGQKPDEHDIEVLQTILNDFDLKTMMEQIKDL